MMLIRLHTRLIALFILLPLFATALTIPPNIHARSSVEDITSNSDALPSESAQFVPFNRREEQGGTVTTEEMTPGILKQPIPGGTAEDPDNDNDGAEGMILRLSSSRCSQGLVSSIIDAVFGGGACRDGNVVPPVVAPYPYRYPYVPGVYPPYSPYFR